MSRTYVIFKREFSSFFDSLMAYFFLVIFLGLVNVFFMWLVFLPSRAVNMTAYFELAKFGFIIFIPAITMKVWADEKKLGTLELIMTMPVRDSEAIIGKFLACMAFVGVALLLSFLTIPTAMAFVGEPDWGPILGGYIGLTLLCACFVAIGLATSSMTENQFISFLLSIIIIVIMLACYDVVGMRDMPGWVLGFLAYMDAGQHFDSISRGVIDSRDLVYYFSVIGFFLFLNYRAVTSRRWK